MGILGRRHRLFVEAVILLSGFCIMTIRAKAAEPGVMTDGIAAGQNDNYITLTEAAGEYEVSEGDSLWRIAENVWGDGSLYANLIKCNPDVITDADVIYPGMILQIARDVYMEKQDSFSDTTMRGQWTFEMPRSWTVGIAQYGSNAANFDYSGNGNSIACLIQDKNKKTVETTADWLLCTKKIEEYAAKNYDELVSGLTFEHYQTEKKEDIYIYSYQYKLDWGEDGKYPYMYVNVCMGMKLTEHIQAQFLGFSMDESIIDTVRYVTAGFEELSSGGEFSLNESDMAITPVYAWELDGMYNAFAWIADSFDYLTKKVIEEAEGTKESEKKQETIISKYPKY